MRKRLLSSCLIVVIALGVSCTCAYADSSSQFQEMIKRIHADRSHREAQLGLDPQADPFPQATSYYDDKVDHYEQVLIMSDFIDKGIR